MEKKQQDQSFYLGLAIGVAAISVIGFIAMTAAYFQKGDVANTDDGENKVAVEDKKVNPTPAPTPTPSAGAPVDIKVTDSDHIRGNKNAKVTIVEFSDYQCPFCSRHHTTMQQVMRDFPNDVRWVYKHFPLDSLHPYARKAAEAAECAGDQDKFWEYTDDLYANQKSITPTYLSDLAKTIGLKSSQFEECLSSGKYVAKVNKDFSEGQAVGVSGTPGSVVNGQLIKGAVPYEQLKATIQNAL